MTNAQVALLAAANAQTERMTPTTGSITGRAEDFLSWLDRKDALVAPDHVKALKAMAAEVQPVICLGDEDSVFLTEQQVGYRAGLLVAAELIEKGSEK